MKNLALLTGVILVIGLLYLYRRFKVEGFVNLNVSPSLFVASVPPSGADDVSDLSPGAAMSPDTEKIIESAALPAMPMAEAEANWGKMNSQTCYKSDIGESLKLTRNYLQRTNNYERKHPDDCSAPNHEFVGTCYTPFDGVGRIPDCGTNYPPSTQCGGESKFAI
jgi:hypothetical protein